uniref:TcmA/NAT10 helicase domain-containing protein n=1 Tax=Amorphochlora amoebiformis TaxID=1561963 RepID=A0A0H5BIL1_9EUKA|nr:hypothetical protein [Amorphochlora amoebiformis]
MNYLTHKKYSHVNNLVIQNILKGTRISIAISKNKIINHVVKILFFYFMENSSFRIRVLWIANADKKKSLGTQLNSSKIITILYLLTEFELVKKCDIKKVLSNNYSIIVILFKKIDCTKDFIKQLYASYTIIAKGFFLIGINYKTMVKMLNSNKNSSKKKDTIYKLMMSFIIRTNGLLFICDKQYTIFKNFDYGCMVNDKISIIDDRMKPFCKNLLTNKLTKGIKLLIKIALKTKTLDQCRSTIQIIYNLIEQKNIIIGVVSNTGRGKSSLFGLIAPILCSIGYHKVILCAYKLHDLQVIFQYCYIALKLLGYLEKKDFLINFKYKILKKSSNIFFKSNLFKYIKIQRFISILNIKYSDIVFYDGHLNSKMLILLQNIKLLRIILGMNNYDYFIYKVINITIVSSNQLLSYRCGFSFFYRIIKLIVPIRYHINDIIEKWIEYFFGFEKKILYYNFNPLNKIKYFIYRPKYFIKNRNKDSLSSRKNFFKFVKYFSTFLLHKPHTNTITHIYGEKNVFYIIPSLEKDSLKSIFFQLIGILKIQYLPSVRHSEKLLQFHSSNKLNISIYRSYFTIFKIGLLINELTIIPHLQNKGFGSSLLSLLFKRSVVNQLFEIEAIKKISKFHISNLVLTIKCKFNLKLISFLKKNAFFPILYITTDSFRFPDQYIIFIKLPFLKFSFLFYLMEDISKENSINYALNIKCPYQISPLSLCFLLKNQNSTGNSKIRKVKALNNRTNAIFLNFFDILNSILFFEGFLKLKNIIDMVKKFYIIAVHDIFFHELTLTEQIVLYFIYKGIVSRRIYKKYLKLNEIKVRLTTKDE